MQHKLDVLNGTIGTDQGKKTPFFRNISPISMSEVIPSIPTIKLIVSEAASSMIPNFLPHLFQPVLFSSTTSQGNHTASSQYSSDSNSCASWKKQKIRHIKWQGIGLAGYFCTLLIRETCIVYTRAFPREQGRKRGKTDNLMYAMKVYIRK